MGYWVSLFGDDGEHVTVPRHQEGGVVVVGGSCEAHISITYNYSPIYRGMAAFSLRDLNGKRAGETVSILESVVKCVGTANDSDDYWEPTPGNAGRAAAVLLEWAKLHPQATWRVA